MPTERQIANAQVSKRPKIDPSIYLRAYHVTQSLDRAENTSWWEKLLERFGTFRARAQAQPRITRLAAAIPEEAPAIREPLLLLAAPIETPPVISVSTYSQPDANEFLQTTIAKTPRVSWVLLAVIAVITAGLTFAVVHFAWPSLSAGPGGERPRHAAIYLTTRS